MREIAVASQVLKRIFNPDKLNVGALGNRVRQLHVHVLARFVSDEAWPGPVWGVGEARPIRRTWPASPWNGSWMRCARRD